MEVRMVRALGAERVVLLDDKMEVVSPVAGYLEHLRLKDRAPGTLRSYAYDLGIFWRFLQEKGIGFDEVVPDDMNSFKAYLRSGSTDVLALYLESERCASTINRILSTVRGFYAYCGDFGIAACNPVVMKAAAMPPGSLKGMLHHAKSDNRTLKGVFTVKESGRSVHLVTDGELESVAKAMTCERNRVLLRFLRATGARIQEALDLDIAQVPLPDPERPVAVIPCIKSKGKLRDLFVPMQTVEMLDAYIIGERAAHSGEALFCSYGSSFDGNRYTRGAATQMLGDACARAGVRFRFHDLRHTYNSALAEAGVDVAVRQLLLGHAHAGTTDRYTHLSERHVTDALASYWERSAML